MLLAATGFELSGLRKELFDIQVITEWKLTLNAYFVFFWFQLISRWRLLFYKNIASLNG